MDDARALHRETARAWDEAAEAYEREVEADIEALRGGLMDFCPPELGLVRELCRDCARAIHLQCAGGRDTLGLWNAGAREVVGIDISARMLACARRKSDALGAPARWVCADVLDAPADLDGTADLVYTGRGALCWMMDIDAWARAAARLLAPGGALLVFDGHPIASMFDMEADELRLDPEFGDYFLDAVVTCHGWPSTYVGDLGKPEAEHAAKHERLHTIGAIVTAVARAGLRVDLLGEHPDPFWNEFPNLPEDTRRRIPNTFTLLARRVP